MNELVKTVLPWISSALLGPAGGMAVDFIADKLGLTEATVDKVKTVLNGSTPEQLLALKSADNDFKFKMTELGYKNEEQLAMYDAQQIISVNQTMQAEAANSDKEAWYQKLWRPMNGFCVAFASGWTVYKVCDLFEIAIQSHDLTALNTIPSLVTSIAFILSIPGAAVGISAYQRGKQKRELQALLTGSATAEATGDK